MMAKVIRLHDYQNDVLSRLTEAWRNHRSVMLQMPTGTGKTIVLAALVSEECGVRNVECSGTQVVIVAHRRELVAQIEETIGRYGIRGTDGNIRVMSIQWLSRHWEEMTEKPQLVIIDEAHHAQAKTYREMWSRWPQARFLGLTATPCRMNRSGFTDLFEVLVTSWSIAEFIEKGRLSAFDYVSIRANSREQRLIDSLEKRGADGDYQIKEMNEVLNRRPSIERLYESVRRYADGRKGIVYAISIEHARRIAEYYNLQGINAVAIDSRTPAVERKRLVEEFKAGKIRVLVNVDVFSEGFDCPDVEFVQMARPTLSLAKYLQQVGRGLRMSKGKEACVLIDNVGLYRVFGLPTAAWDWEAMFRGDIPGKGTRAAGMRKEAAMERPATELPGTGARGGEAEMEVVVSHDRLLSVLEEQRSMQPVHAQGKATLKAWQDGDSGLWGLRLGKRKVTEAVYITVFDIRYEMAAVRLGDRLCGLVGASGETLWKRAGCRSMRFSRNNFLLIRTTDGREHYLDLHGMRMYADRPEIIRYGDVELLKVGGMYYSRTKTVYVNDGGLNSDFITTCRFGIAILDDNAPASCRIRSPYAGGWGYACILNGDHESFYWLCRLLADGSVIVADNAGRYYHTDDGRTKEYIGEAGAAERLAAGIERIAGQAVRRQAMADAEKAEKRRRLLSGTAEAVPFRSGMKWGLKVGSRVTVPPIYRNVKPPVGKYCAVEKGYSRWGVVALDGTLMVDTRYSDIEISTQGTVTGTMPTGTKVSMKLP